MLLRCIMGTGLGSRLAGFQPRIDAMAAVDRMAAFAVVEIVLAEMDTGFAGLGVHINHLTHIIEFITLKVNRVINSKL